MLDYYLFANCLCFCSIGSSIADDIVVNAFMTIFAYLYGNYRDFLKPDHQAEAKVFQVYRICRNLGGKKFFVGP